MGNYYRWALLWGLSLGLFTSLHAQNVISTETPVYDNVGLDKVKISLHFFDQEIKSQNVPAEIQVYFADTFTKIDSLQKKGAFLNLQLPVNSVFDLQIQADKYLDTTLRVDISAIEEYQLSYEVALKADKIPLDISIRDLNTEEALPLGGIVRNRSRVEEILLNPDQNNPGNYRVQVREEDEYELEVRSSEGYVFYTNNRIIPKRDEENSLAVKVVKELQPGLNIRLYGVSFAYNSFNLNEHSRSELKRILPLLRQYTDLRLEIAAHTDSDGTNRKNLRLSDNRATAVKHFLVNHGIPADRLSTKGYADSQPIASNATPSGRAKNRRFELKIISVGSAN